MYSTSAQLRITEVQTASARLEGEERSARAGLGRDHERTSSATGSRRAPSPEGGP